MWTFFNSIDELVKLYNKALVDAYTYNIFLQLCRLMLIYKYVNIFFPIMCELLLVYVEIIINPN